MIARISDQSLGESRVAMPVARLARACSTRLWRRHSGGWSGLMAWVWRSIGGPVSAGFAVLAHIAIAGYVVGVPRSVLGVSMLLLGICEPSSEAWSGMLLLLGGLVLFNVSRWIEKIIAGYCIRLYLRRIPGKP